MVPLSSDLLITCKELRLKYFTLHIGPVAFGVYLSTMNISSTFNEQCTGSIVWWELCVCITFSLSWYCHESLGMLPYWSPFGRFMVSFITPSLCYLRLLVCVVLALCLLAAGFLYICFLIWWFYHLLVALYLTFSFFIDLGIYALVYLTLSLLCVCVS